MDDSRQWNVIRVTMDEYKGYVPDRRIFFNEPDFTELNKDKVDDVHYLVIMKAHSPRFGLILGIKDGVAKCPFSAPYAYPVIIGANAHMEAFDQAIIAIERYCAVQSIHEIRFVFPPFIYDEDTLSAWVSAMYRVGYKPSNIDMNYTLYLKELNVENYDHLITRKARSHLRKAISSGIEIIKCSNDSELSEAYDIIYENHTVKGRPTHMTLEQLKETFALVRHDAFVARFNGKGIAAMIYYEITKEIVQCIYSGYILDYSDSGVMNYLTWYAIKYYGDQGYRIIDRATATENSIPNYGLCDFKESVGAKRSLKYSFYKTIVPNQL